MDIEETKTHVRLSVFIPRAGLLAGHDDCIDAVRVKLASPLGDRTLIDTFMGEVLVAQTD